MPEPENPIAAVVHPDPYPYYARLARERPLCRDQELGLWIAAGPKEVRAVLASELCRVRPPAEPVPRALHPAAAALFERLARTNDGPRHAAARAATEAQLAAITPAAVGQAGARIGPRLARRPGFQFHFPAQVMASLLGAPDALLDSAADWTTALVRCYAPVASAAELERGDEAAAGLLATFDATAIGLLVQTHDATAGLIGNTLRSLARQVPESLEQAVLRALSTDPPVQNTRRWVACDGSVAGTPMREGDGILVVLAASAEPFGRGRHACPGAELSVAIAAAAIEQLLLAGVELRPAGRHPSMNVRIALFE